MVREEEVVVGDEGGRVLGEWLGGRAYLGHGNDTAGGFDSRLCNFRRHGEGFWLSIEGGGAALREVGGGCR